MSIIQKIEDLIINDLKSLGIKTEEQVDKYRDKYFLSGQYDYLFEKFIKENIK